MADQEQVLIEVKFDSTMVAEAAKKVTYATEEIKRLKAEQKTLNDQWKAGTITNEEYGRAIAENSKELEANKRAVKSNTAVVQAATMAQYDSNASLDEQRQFLGTLQKAYASMDKEQKEMAGGQATLETMIGNVTKSIKEQEHAIGDDRRNVGNYADSIVEAAGKTHDLADAFKVSSVASTGLGKATDAVDKAMKLAAKNPWMAVLSLLLPLLQALFKALKGNEQAMAEVKKIMDALKAAFKQFEPVIKTYAQLLTKVLGKAFEFITAAISKVLKGVDWLAQKLGFDLHLSDVFEQAAQSASDAADSVEESDNRMVESANKRNAALIKSAEELKKINDQIVEWLLGELDASTKEYMDALDEKYKKLKESNDKLLAGLNEDEEEEDEDEENILTPEEMARNMFGLDDEGVAYFKQLLDEGLDYHAAAAKAQEQMWGRQAKGVLNILHNMGDGFSAMGDVLGNFADQSEDAAKAQKAFALMGILTNEAASISEGALAISEGIASAAELPFPANIPAIITITATIAGLIAGVASTISQAKQLFKQADAGKFATGGIVGGTSYSGDNMVAHVNSREMILPMDAQKNLFDALTGSDNGNAKLGIDYERMAAAFAAAPAPNLVLTELAQEQEKIVTYNEIAGV